MIMGLLCVSPVMLVAWLVRVVQHLALNAPWMQIDLMILSIKNVLAYLLSQMLVSSIAWNVLIVARGVLVQLLFAQHAILLEQIGWITQELQILVLVKMAILMME